MLFAACNAAIPELSKLSYPATTATNIPALDKHKEHEAMSSLMAIQNSPPDDPYTAADLAAIFAAPRVPMFSNMNPFLEARLQHFATTEVESQEAGIQERDRVSHPRGTGSWAWELAQLFNQGFRQPYGEPFVRFYREASRKLIDSEYVHDKGFDLSYLLFKMKQGKPEELSSGTILRALRQQRKNAK